MISGGAGLIFRGSGFYVTDYKKPHLPERKQEKGTQLKKSDEKPKPPANTPGESKD